MRFYANAMQRTQATARYFSAGLLPVTVVPVERHAEYNTMDPVFNPALTLFTDEYVKDVVAQIAEAGGADGMKGIHAEMADIARDEIENARGAIPDVQADSRLGWEPSMEYMCDQAHLEWKIALLEKTLASLSRKREA